MEPQEAQKKKLAQSLVITLLVVFFIFIFIKFVFL